MPLFRALVAVLALHAFSAAAAAAQGLNVSVSIEGVGRELRNEIRPLSALARSPGNFSALAPIRRAANSDAQTLLAYLQSQGYYAATVEPSLTREEDDVTVTFTIERGARFAITDYQVSYAEDRESPRPGTLEEAGIEADGSPTGAALQDIENALLERLWNDGYLSAEVARREVRSDFSTGDATAVFDLRTGPQGRFGEIEVEGTTRTDADYIRQFRPFEEGQLASRKDIETYRERLVETGLFSEIEVEPELPDESGTTDVLVRVEERDHRTIGGGLSYATDIGPGVNAFWENRNLLGRGENLRTAIAVSQPIQEGSASFRKWRPRLPGYYQLSAVIRNEDTDAFNAQTAEIGGALGKLWLDRNLTTSGGLRYHYSDIDTSEAGDEGEAVERRDIFQAISIPMAVIWNSQSQPLDPQDGWIASFMAEPFFGTQNFSKFEIGAVDRVFWGENDGGTLAGRFRIGAIYGAPREVIPATERYYAGGGGSIRGYAYQEASPIDQLTGDILGGASIAEFNVELRQHVTDKIELAVFSDFGGAFESNNPDFENVLVGAGAGIRYHTPIGPVRVDFAVPLETRTVRVPNPEFDPSDPESDEFLTKFSDDEWQFYIAIGQPF